MRRSCLPFWISGFLALLVTGAAAHEEPGKEGGREHRAGPAAATGVRMTMERLHALGGVPRGWWRSWTARPARPFLTSRWKQAPTKIELWFHEELDTKLSSFTVHNQQNERVDNGDGKVNLDEADRKMLEGTVSALPPGIYTVRWKAAGEDDKAVVEGTFTFRVRQ